MTKSELYALLAEAVPSAGWSDSPGMETTLTSLDVILIVVRLYDQYGIRIPSQEIKSGRITLEEIEEMDEKELKQSVRISIFMKDPAVLDKYSVKQSTGSSAKSYDAKIGKAQLTVEQRINKSLGRKLKVKSSRKRISNYM